MDEFCDYLAREIGYRVLELDKGIKQELGEIGMAMRLIMARDR
jgi:hypothetical protein